MGLEKQWVLDSHGTGTQNVIYFIQYTLQYSVET